MKISKKNKAVNTYVYIDGKLVAGFGYEEHADIFIEALRDKAQDIEP